MNKNLEKINDELFAKFEEFEIPKKTINKIIMRIFFTVGLILYSLHSPLFCQVKLDYTKQYYPSVNRAELSIVDSNYQEALVLYQEAFKNVKGGFAIDFYRAFVCSLMNNDQAVMLPLFDSLIVRGFELDAILDKIKDTEIVKRLEEHPNWQTFKLVYPKKRVEVLIQQDLPLKLRLEEMYFYDQIYRGALYESKLDTIQIIDNSNVAFLKELLVSGKFPNEKEIGRNSLDESDYPYSVIILHYATRQISLDGGEYRKEFSPLLLEAVKQGKLPVQLFCDYEDRNRAEPHLFNPNGETKYASTALINFRNGPNGYIPKSEREDIFSNGKMYYRKYYDIHRQEIDKNRAELGLGTFEQYLKKCLFGLTDNLFLFPKYVSILNIEGVYVEHLMKNWVEIER